MTNPFRLTSTFALMMTTTVHRPNSFDDTTFNCSHSDVLLKILKCSKIKAVVLIITFYLQVRTLSPRARSPCPRRLLRRSPMTAPRSRRPPSGPSRRPKRSRRRSWRALMEPVSRRSAPPFTSSGPRPSDPPGTPSFPAGPSPRGTGRINSMEKNVFQLFY